ncbi:sulfatase-like hydrolase/transferase (plasmid) [Halococcus dombrowskii]|uniref:Sulfatase n=1 Tax=Halococcus dombrowskii TaxID=179637 RepID=A0AAV3SDM7_HALDO|nr:sulfatase [Halococcus dombrowskii]UOO96654.1 sulfatase-like hydrolase/transferase [Halococcus dombrowskii]
MPVIYIDIDSLRSDHVGAYGYNQPTTPNIDEFATDAVRFNRSYVANSPCLPSRAALITGRYGIHNGIETHGPLSQSFNSPASQIDWAGTWGDHIDERPWWTLPELFYKQRTSTCAVSSFPRHPAPWFHHAWHEVQQPQEPEGPNESFQTVRAETVIDLALDFIQQHADEEFFLYVQLWDPHGPYKRSEEQVDAFRSESLPPYPTAEQINQHQQWDAWRSASHMDIDDRTDLAEMLAHYDAEIHYADRHIGRLLDFLHNQALYDESFVTITADHGEEFGEHGLYREHWSTHDGTQRVPLIIKPPADQPIESGTRDQLVTNVDMPPTLADYAGFNTPTRWQGQSLRPVIENAKAEWRDHIVVDHGLYTAQRAIRTEQWKFIRTYHPGMWSATVPEHQLYDMHEDPQEQDNVVEDFSDVATNLEERMAVWAEEYGTDNEDPIRVVADQGPAGYNAFQSDYEGV